MIKRSSSFCPSLSRCIDDRAARSPREGEASVVGPELDRMEDFGSGHNGCDGDVNGCDGVDVAVDGCDSLVHGDSGYCGRVDGCIDCEGGVCDGNGIGNGGVREGDVDLAVDCRDGDGGCCDTVDGCDKWDGGRDFCEGDGDGVRAPAEEDGRACSSVLDAIANSSGTISPYRSQPYPGGGSALSVACPSLTLFKSTSSMR